jgi:hypothetical protein
VAQQLKEQLFKNTELENKASNLKAKLKHEYSILDKVEPSYATLRRVLDLAKLNGIDGVKGLFIDFVECSPQINCVVDIAGK